MTDTEWRSGTKVFFNYDPITTYIVEYVWGPVDGSMLVKLTGYPASVRIKRLEKVSD